ncbi:manganese catalase family protein [Priestia megaterium]|jgi:Mn-containing catalase|uniref:manganese catalase family protein n=1 Tax=Priestia megaterium TaxID=1404 RepID=UPI0035B5547E
MNTGAEELANILILTTVVTRLLDGVTVWDLEKAALSPVTGAILEEMNPQHVIVSCLDAMPADSLLSQ